MNAAKTPEKSSPDTATKKTWVAKTPVEVFLEQIAKQEKRVATLQKELDAEKAQLVKLQKAKAVLEA